MVTRVSVISSTNTKGEIAPLWLKIPLGEDSLTYKVLWSNRTVTEPIWSGYITYICMIKKENKEQEIRLRYNVKEHFWEAVYNNSSKI